MARLDNRNGDDLEDGPPRLSDEQVLALLAVEAGTLRRLNSEWVAGEGAVRFSGDLLDTLENIELINIAGAFTRGHVEITGVGVDLLYRISSWFEPEL